MILSEMKSSKDAITRGTLSGSKCTKIDVGWGFAPDPTGGAYSAPPDPVTGFKGPTSKGKGEGLGRGKGEGGRGWGTNRPPHDKILATPLSGSGQCTGGTSLKHDDNPSLKRDCATPTSQLIG